MKQFYSLLTIDNQIYLIDNNSIIKHFTRGLNSDIAYTNLIFNYTSNNYELHYCNAIRNICLTEILDLINKNKIKAYKQ